MSDRQGRTNAERFPHRKNASGRQLCLVCGELTPDNRHTFCGPRCLRDFYMQTDWQRVRTVIYARDGGICMKCGRHVRKNDFHVDHLKPIAAGGDEWALDNLELSCPQCNLQKGRKEEIEYLILPQARKRQK